MRISLENQVAVVTGGSRGIGAAAVTLFAAAGCNVVFSYLRAAGAAQKVVNACRNAPGSVLAVRADVSRMADARKLIDKAIRRFGRLDILVANAGIWNADPERSEEMTESQWDKMVAVNLKGVYSVIRCAVPQMIRQNRGRIIAVSSTAGQRGEAFHTHYGAAKGGVISLVKGLATELAPHNILVNAVCPGPIRGPLWEGPGALAEQLGKVLGMSGPEVVKWFAEQNIPLGHHGDPEDIANMVVFLASDRAKFITGQCINVDGGMVKTVV